MKSLFALLLASAGLLVSTAAFAQEAAPAPEPTVAAEAPAAPASTPAPAAEPAPTPAAEAEPVAPKIAVIAPEQVDGEWFWYAYGGGNQHIVQSEVEKALVRAGFDVVDVSALGSWRSLDDLVGARTAADKGKELGVDYVIAGKATAVKASEGAAYGVTVIRANAEISLRLVRVSDGKVLAVEDANAQAGGQAVRAAGQAALKTAGQQIARKMTAAVRTAVAPK
jgi:curli biogenesis system outer membrane secretion channel CsgG